MGKIVKAKENDCLTRSILIADPDINITAPIHTLFSAELKEMACVMGFTEKACLQEYLEEKKAADVLVVSEDFLSEDMLLLDINEIYILTDNPVYCGEEPILELENIRYIYKYSSPERILREIVDASGSLLNIFTADRKACRITAVYSPAGGTGKTTISLGLCRCLHETRRRVLYISAQQLPYFDHRICECGRESEALSGQDDIKDMDSLREVLGQSADGGFLYLPPFRAALTSLNADPGIFEKIAVMARQSAEFDHVIIDTDSTFDSYKSRILALADEVIITVRPDKSCMEALKAFRENVKDPDSDRYLLVCTDITGEGSSDISFSEAGWNGSTEYLEHIKGMDETCIEGLAQIRGIQRVARFVS